jgi:hypothetical protein
MPHGEGLYLFNIAKQLSERYGIAHIIWQIDPWFN